MRIAYVTTYDATDIHAWSGLGSLIYQTLNNIGFQVHCIGNLSEKYLYSTSFKKLFYSLMLSKKYLRDREPAVLKYYAAQVEKALDRINCDLIFSPGTLPIAYVQTEKPLVFWADSTFAGMVDFYPGFRNLCTKTIIDGNKMEQLALKKCRLAIYTSEWAAETAILKYDVDPAKVKVVPFGANINCDRTMSSIESILEAKDYSVCKLLFVGVDWLRKGGDIAVRVTEILNKRGIKTNLHVVGCKPTTKLPDYVIQHGFISKKTIEGRAYLDSLFSQSHFLILPSQAECYGVVFPEASSFGLPSLATKVGGIPTAIKDGRNGQTFSLDADPVCYCDYIEEVISSKKAYNELAKSSFKEYSDRLNWSISGLKVKDLIHQFCY